MLWALILALLPEARAGLHHNSELGATCSLRSWDHQGAVSLIRNEYALDQKPATGFFSRSQLYEEEPEERKHPTHLPPHPRTHAIPSSQQNTQETNQAQGTIYLPCPVPINSFSLGLRRMQYDKSLTPWLLTSLPWNFVIIFGLPHGSPTWCAKGFSNSAGQDGAYHFPPETSASRVFVICHQALELETSDSSYTPFSHALRSVNLTPKCLQIQLLHPSHSEPHMAAREICLKCKSDCAFRPP